MIKYIIVIVVFFAVLAMVYIRLAPIDLRDIHTQSLARAPGDYPSKGGFIAVREITDTRTNLSGAINRVILKTPRTRRVAGDLGTELMTYQTRSAVFGLPDYATVSFASDSEAGTLMIIKSHLVYGVSDIGVNEKRVKGWLEELGDLTVTP